MLFLNYVCAVLSEANLEKRAAEKLARTLNVIVIAYENPVNALGLPAFVSDEWNTQKNTIEKRYWQPVNKRIF